MSPRNPPLPRTAALVALGALIVHQLRYFGAYGGDAGRELAAQGHGYLGQLTPLVIALALAAVAGCLVRAALTGRTGRGRGRLGSRPRSSRSRSSPRSRLRRPSRASSSRATWTGSARSSAGVAGSLCRWRSSSASPPRSLTRASAASSRSWPLLAPARRRARRGVRAVRRPQPSSCPASHRSRWGPRAGRRPSPAEPVLQGRLPEPAMTAGQQPRPSEGVFICDPTLRALSPDWWLSRWR